MGAAQSQSDITIHDTYRTETDKFGKEFPFLNVKIQQENLLNPSNINKTAKTMLEENSHILRKYADYMFEDSEKSRMMPIIYEIESTLKIKPNETTTPEEAATKQKNIKRLSMMFLQPIIHRIITQMNNIETTTDTLLIDPTPELNNYINVVEKLSSRFANDPATINTTPIQYNEPFLKKYTDLTTPNKETFTKDTLTSLRMLADKYKNFPTMLRYIHLIATMITIAETWKSTPTILGGNDLIDVSHLITRYDMKMAIKEKNPLPTHITILYTGISLIYIISHLNLLLKTWAALTGGRQILNDPPSPPIGTSPEPTKAISIQESGTLTNTTHNIIPKLMQIYNINANTIQSYLRQSPTPVDTSLDSVLTEITTKFTANPKITHEITPLVNKSIKLMALGLLNKINTKLNNPEPLQITEQDQVIIDSLNYTARRIITKQTAPTPPVQMTEPEIKEYLQSGDVHQENASGKIQTLCAYLEKKATKYPIMVNYIRNISAITNSIDLIEQSQDAEHYTGGVVNNINLVLQFMFFVTSTITLYKVLTDKDYDQISTLRYIKEFIRELPEIIHMGNAFLNKSKKPDYGQLSDYEYQYGRLGGGKLFDNIPCFIELIKPTLCILMISLIIFLSIIIIFLIYHTILDEPPNVCQMHIQ